MTKVISNSLFSLLCMCIIYLNSYECATCHSDHFGLYKCCYQYTAPTQESVIISCPLNTTLITIVDVVHCYNVTGQCSSNGQIQHQCNESDSGITWKGIDSSLSDEACLNTSNECTCGINPKQIDSSHSCYSIEGDEWTAAVIISIYCHTNIDEDELSSTRSTPVTGGIVTLPPTHKPSTVAAGGVETSIPSGDNPGEMSTERTSEKQNITPSSTNVTRSEKSEMATATMILQSSILTDSPNKSSQSNLSAAIGGGVVAVVMIVVIVVLAVVFVRRRTKKSRGNDTNVYMNQKTPDKSTVIEYEDVGVYSNNNKSQYNKLNLHSDSNHYDNAEGKKATDKSHYRNADKNTNDNVKQEVMNGEKQKDEKLDLYSVPVKPESKPPGGEDRGQTRTLQRVKESSEYSIYPTVPQKSFDNLNSNVDGSNYADIDLEKSEIARSLQKKVKPNPPGDLNYATIQF